MRINSIFPTIQGEGIRVGMPEVFVRFQGCSIGCHWCDTPEALCIEKGKEKSIKEILSAISKFGVKNVSLTGGEPLDQKSEDLLDLIKELRKREFFITLETSGQKFNREIMSKVNFISADIKPPSSGIKPNFSGLKRINKFKEKQFKIVVSNKADFAFAKRMSKIFSNVVITPAWRTNTALNKKKIQKLVSEAIRSRVNLRIIIQQHKVIFGHKKDV